MCALGGLELLTTYAPITPYDGRGGARGFEWSRDQSGRLPDTGLVALAQEVIRRLSSHTRRLEDKVAVPSSQEIEAFCVALVSEDDEAAAGMIEGMRASGCSSEMICLKYLAAAARTLGLWWTEDRASFVEVTIGTGRMSAILHGLLPGNTETSRQHEVPLIFAAVPGEQHTFGVAMAAELFRRDGWRVTLEIGLTHDELVAAVERSPGSIVGLSIGSQRSFRGLARLVCELNASCPHTAILVSGQAVEALRPFLANMEVDEIACDIDDAKVKISHLWETNNTDWQTRGKEDAQGLDAIYGSQSVSGDRL